MARTTAQVVAVAMTAVARGPAGGISGVVEEDVVPWLVGTGAGGAGVAIHAKGGVMYGIMAAQPEVMADSVGATHGNTLLQVVDVTAVLRLPSGLGPPLLWDTTQV